jgi:peptidoglycan hydrolase CwlO-like protein
MKKIAQMVSGNKGLIFKIIIALIVIVSLFFIFKNKQGYVAGIIDNLVQSRVKETIKNYDEKIKVIAADNVISQKKIKSLNKKIEELEGNIHENKKPETSGELRDRFIALGFKPVEQ